ncbi:MAG: orotidine-5'-phosphate decarboxylase [Pseudomonadota bacterium]
MSGTSSQSTAHTIVALDFSSSDAALDFVATVNPEICKVKVGFELFINSGPQVVKDLIDRDFDVFLDMKLHDIPNTVAAACERACELGVWMLNIHATGGLPMMLAAKQAVNSANPQTKLLAVTILTSLDNQDLNDLGINKNLEEQVISLAMKAKESELDGVVCSANEAKRIKSACGSNFIVVTPGIRLEASKIRSEDQKRVVTPKEAAESGSDFVVVGRPVINSSNPIETIKHINSFFN